MALLHVHRTPADGCSATDGDVVSASDLLAGDSTSPTMEVVGVEGRVQEMVLRFSMIDNGLYDKTYSLCLCIALADG